MFGKSVLRKIFGPKGDGVTGRWRELHNEEPHYLYSSYNQNDEVEDVLGRLCSTNGVKRNTCSLLVGYEKGKRPLGILRHRWVDNIKMNRRYRMKGYGLD